MCTSITVDSCIRDLMQVCQYVWPFPGYSLPRPRKTPAHANTRPCLKLFVLLLQKHSHRITAAQHRKAIEATNMNSIRDRVERQLRLRHLQRDPTLPPEQFLSCCSRMLSNSVTLINLIESQSVRVSHSNVVSQDGSTIDIAWNFEL